MDRSVERGSADRPRVSIVVSVLAGGVGAFGLMTGLALVAGHGAALGAAAAGVVLALVGAAMVVWAVGS